MTPPPMHHRRPILISIHMPHTWHDARLYRRCRTRLPISIHMPHTWHDGTLNKVFAGQTNFNPHATYVA